MEFRDLKEAVSRKWEELKTEELFRTAVNADKVWDTYLSSFAPGDDPIHKERTEHNCSACRSFIRAIGNVVALDSHGDRISLWDIQIGGKYQPVVDALSALVKSKPIENIFLHTEHSAGVDKNHQETDTGIITWEHLHAKIPRNFVKKDPGSTLSRSRSMNSVMFRGLTEITEDAIETTLEILGNIYRGEENREALSKFKALKSAFMQSSNKDDFCWSRIGGTFHSVACIRNTAIGTLLVELSEGKDLEEAVRAFEQKVAPSNYKRPKAVITKSMIKNAQKTIEELGYTDALPRRYAVAEDLTINNVLFADRSSKIRGNVFEELMDEAPTKAPGNIEEMGVEEFLTEVIPTAKSVDVLVENKHRSNLVSLIAPVNPEAKGMFKWGNNFSWTYSGDVADSMKERVKAMGGKVDGVLRFSIQWNTEDDNKSDLDAHCSEPNGNTIYFRNKGVQHSSSGMLDVDIVHPRGPAVENITWSDESRMSRGTYKFKVHCYTERAARSGFTAEIEYAGNIYSFECRRPLSEGEYVQVATLDLGRKGLAAAKLVPSLPEGNSSQDVWGIRTHTYQKVEMIMNSPNHWDGESTGNKHVFFMLQGCKQEGDARGFYNEFLTDSFREHRKVLEVLGNKMRAEPSDNQLSGVGFSTTQRNSIVCRVNNRHIRVNI